jgi:hypothetical protein
MARSKDLSDAQCMVNMQDLEYVLTALNFASTGSFDLVRQIVGRQLYRDPSNPLRKLINQYNASIDLLATPPEGEA